MITLHLENPAPGNIPEAVRQANLLLNGTELYEQIALRKKPFDFSIPKDLTPQVVADALKNFTMTFKVSPEKLGSTTTGSYTCSPSSRGILKISNRPYHIDNSVGAIAGTLVHECIHALDCFSSEFQLSHGNNSSVGKENSAPYWIGNLVANLINGTSNFDYQLLVESNIGDAVEDDTENYELLPMMVAELAVRSSVQVFQADPSDSKPVGFGSGCVVNYRDRVFLISVSHVTNKDDLVTYIETNLPFDPITGTITQPVGGMCYFEMLKLETEHIDDLEKFLKTGKRLDISFGEITEFIPLLQPFLKYGGLTVEHGAKVMRYGNEFVEPTKEGEYIAFGKIKHKYSGQVLHSTPTIKHNLKFHGIRKGVYMFLSPTIITDSDDYPGCSGAPILDMKGDIVAFMIIVGVPSKIIYAFPANQVLPLIDKALAIGML